MTRTRPDGGIRLNDRAAVVTSGGGSGIGYSISSVLLKQGSHVVICKIDLNAKKGGCHRVKKAAAA